MMKHFGNILRVLFLAALAITLSAQNTNVQAIKFTNEKIRPGSEHILFAFDFCEDLDDEWNATGMAANFPAGTDKVRDNCTKDGRTCITNDDASLVVTACQALIAFVNGGVVPTANRLNVLVKPAVNRRSPTTP